MKNVTISFKRIHSPVEILKECGSMMCGYGWIKCELVNNHQILIALWNSLQWGSIIKPNKNFRKLLQLQMEKWLLFILFENTGGGQVLQTQQSNALLQNMHVWLDVCVCVCGGRVTLTSIPSTRQCNSGCFIKCNWEDCSLSWCIAFDFIIQVFGTYQWQFKSYDVWVSDVKEPFIKLW